MRSETVTAVLDAPRDEVFDYFSKIENLSDWATEFARELKWKDGEAVVVNGLGEFVFRIAADPATGVIDMLSGPSTDELALFPTRVVALPEGRSAFTFTMFQAPGMPDALFESQHDSLVREFDNIRTRFSHWRQRGDSCRRSSACEHLQRAIDVALGVVGVPRRSQSSSTHGCLDSGRRELLGGTGRV